MVDVIGRPGNVIKGALITAFSLAAALIWRDVILEFSLVFFPNTIYYKIIAAIIATILAVIAIWIVVKTENEAEYYITKLTKNEIKKGVAIKEKK
jgi:uncharacterized protein YacL